MRDLIDLLRFWDSRQDNLALCTLIGREGSVYRALGAKKLIGRDGGVCGLLSGGCLEQEIERTVRDEWDQLPFIRSFSTMSPEDELFGYQSGCAGRIDILCEKLPERVSDRALYVPFGDPAAAAGVLIELDQHKLGQRRYADAPSGPKAYFDQWQRPVRLSVVGCGLDAPAFHDLAAPLGWDIHFFDYRDSMRANLPAGAGLTIVPLEDIFEALPQGDKSAVMVMTHNYLADREILQNLARGEAGFGYVGFLGPKRRFAQMEGELPAPLPDRIKDILHPSPGLYRHTHDMSSIALSVIADIDSRLGNR